MRLFSLSCLLLCSMLTTSILAQPEPILRPSSVPTLALPALDNDLLRQEELSLRVPGRAPRYAEVRKVDIRPESAGIWEVNGDGTSTWRLRISSPNAESINLGFTEFVMPQGGELYLHTGKKNNWQVRGPYTPADNEVHNQLWTPIVNGDELVIEVTLPQSERSNLQLWLTDVNHDFLGFSANIEKSGSCNVDVVCGASDGLAIVDKYRDIIRSVVVYSRGGGTFCTGFLVNNVTQDGTPYFMTADHCGMNAGNAASLVAYYNFENSTCRAVGSAASGGGGDGVLGVNNTGAIFRAGNSNSDMTLLELDDPIPAAANAFLAGWDNTFVEPTDTVIAIHHPSTDEKRISFSFQQTTFTGGTNLRVPDWDIGTTEPGSSGSPIFDRFHRVRGQLEGGLAACGNDSFDTYGAFAQSWNGGASAATRLSDWLDPNNTGATVIDGRDVNSLPATVVSSPSAQNACGTAPAEFEISIGGGFDGDVTLSIEDLPNGLTASYSQNPTAPGSTVTLTVSANSATTENLNFNLSASDGVIMNSVLLSLNLAESPPNAPTSIAPANNETDVLTTATLEWTGGGSGSYDVQISTTANMSNVVVSGTTMTNEFMNVNPLFQGSTYFWRVRGTNDCGVGQWSEIRQFTTIVLACGGPRQSPNVPLTLGTTGTFTSDLPVGMGDPVESIEVTVNLNHTYVGDLKISLQSPDLGTFVLVDRIGYTGVGNGCSGDDLELTFSDVATNTAADLENTCSNEPAASGTYQPVESMAGFAGQLANGTWTLIIEDLAGGDGGTLNEWSMTICTEISVPVGLTNFSGTAGKCSYSLEWSIAREENFSHYEVEKSANGRNFTTLARVEGGNRAYSLTDDSAKGQAYYRLKMIDLDGTFAYSNLLSAETECGRNSLLALYPNPVDKSRTLQLDFASPLTSGTTFTVFGADGRKLLDKTTTEIGGLTASLNVAELPAGTYFLRVVSGGQAEVRPFVKM